MVETPCLYANAKFAEWSTWIHIDEIPVSACVPTRPCIAAPIFISGTKSVVSQRESNNVDQLHNTPSDSWGWMTERASKMGVFRKASHPISPELCWGSGKDHRRSRHWGKLKPTLYRKLGHYRVLKFLNLTRPLHSYKFLNKDTSQWRHIQIYWSGSTSLKNYWIFLTSPPSQIGLTRSVKTGGSLEGILCFPKGIG